MCDTWPLNMGPIGYPETSLLNQPALRYNPEDEIIQLNRSGSLRSGTYEVAHVYGVIRRTAAKSEMRQRRAGDAGQTSVCLQHSDRSRVRLRQRFERTRNSAPWINMEGDIC